MSVKIITPTPNLTESLEFYKKLNFKVESSGTSYLVSDAKITIELSENKKYRKGFKISTSNKAELINKLSSHAILLNQDDDSIAVDRNGLWYYITEEDFTTADGSNQSILGTNFGVSIETAHMQHTKDLLILLGFKLQMENEEQGFIQLKTKGDFYISLMKPFSCPHLFNNPALNYFNGKDNLNIIDHIKTKNISVYENITAFNTENLVDNISLMDPSGIGFFIFND
ncbi:hypothetical protein [Saccharicrinis aurantiacus]|uniref:hypothetical protein n=1 Tax=Saccharicrinis aurantiacus TaxID=1849719 RepID=UPI0024911023|nr:hypothetical protein [Saccharicrinis aurantiacus]